VYSILEDREGEASPEPSLWFGTLGGVSRYNGEKFTNLTTQDRLVDNAVYSMLQDQDGYLWFGTQRGVSRYDGNRFTNFTTDDGLSDNWVGAILEDREGHLWFGSYWGA
jgi:ligand-binding sensor domain-containing protein